MHHTDSNLQLTPSSPAAPVKICRRVWFIYVRNCTACTLQKKEKQNRNSLIFTHWWCQPTFQFRFSLKCQAHVSYRPTATSRMTWFRVYIQRVVNEAVNFQFLHEFFFFSLHPPLAPRACDFFLHTTHLRSSQPHSSFFSPSSHLSFCPLSIIGFYFQAAISVRVSCVCVSHPIFCLSSIVTLRSYRSHRSLSIFLSV